MLEFKEIQELKPNNELTKIDEEYKNFPIINFIMAKIIDMNITERNQVALFLFNNINS